MKQSGKMNCVLKYLNRFRQDCSGGVPIEVIALTGSLALLGVTVMETQKTGVPQHGIDATEEVFIRKCGQLLSDGGTTSALPQVGGSKNCG